MDRTRSRLDHVAQELCALGLAPEAARRISARVTSNRPLASRAGVPALERWLRRAGVGPEAAREGAAVLFALEGLDLGRPFGRIVSELAAAGVAPARAQGAALEASRIHRAAPPAEDVEPTLPPALVGIALVCNMAMLLVFLHLLSR